VTEAISTETSAIERIRDNPFYVLALRPDATRQAIERQGTKLLGMLELKLKSAAAYATPVGRAERTPEKVRAAMAELRDPSRRLEHEIWARLDPEAIPAPAEDATPGDEDLSPRAPRADDPWPDAFAALGWRAG
jgi:hypothetical protein